MRKIIFITAILTLVALLTAIDKASDFKLENEKGKQVSLFENLKNGFVILDFWADYCVPCKKALPKLNEIHNKYDDVTVITVSTDKPRSQKKAKSYLKTHKYDFVCLFDKNSEVAKMFGVKDIPHSVLIAPDSTIIYTHTGYNKGDEKHYLEEIEKWKAQNSETKDK